MTSTILDNDLENNMMFSKANFLSVNLISFTLSMLCLSQNVHAHDFAINWSKYGVLPPNGNYEKSIGIAGAFSGLIDDRLIVAGGANFPNGHPFFDNGKKEHYSDVFLFDTSKDTLTKVSQSHLPINLSAGASVKWKNDLLLIGGTNAGGDSNRIFQLTITNDKLTVIPFANLPFTWSLGGASVHDGYLYLFAGKVDGQLSRGVWRMPLEQKESRLVLKSERVSELPAIARIQFPSVATKNSFYLFGGINPHGHVVDTNKQSKQYVLTDNYRFNYKTNIWAKLSSKGVDVGTVTAAGGAAVAIDNEQILILGGVNRAIFDDAVGKLKALSGDALVKFKTDYFARTAEQISFSRNVYLYNLAKNSWQRLTNLIPFYGGAGPLNLEYRNSKLFWISGEIKPVIRQPFIYKGLINNIK